MKERLRRILIFVAIVGAGTLLILFDLPLILILPLIIAIGLILLILLGAIPVSELKGMFRKKSAGKPVATETAKKADGKAPTGAGTPQKKRFSISLASFFKRKGTGNEPSPPAIPSQKTTVAGETKKPRFSPDFRSLFRRNPETGKTAPAQTTVRSGQDAASIKKRGLSLHLSALVSSFRQFGTIIKTKKKADPDKLKKIDSMLDAAVHDKPESPVLPPLPQSPRDKPPATRGAAPAAAIGSGLAELPAEEDPFLSLANDELDAGLLEGLDDDDTFGTAPGAAAGGESAEFTVTLPGDDAAVGDTGGVAPLPPEIASAADDILKANETDSGELPALEGLETVDEGLGDLNNLSLDSVDLEDDDDEDNGPDSSLSAAAPAAPAPAAVSTAPAPEPAAPSGKKGSDQSEMAAFAAASGGDDDMLSSLAADIKSVKKEQDLSLLRELKDFRASGTTIETELTDLYSTLNAAAEKQKKVRSKQGVTKQQAK